MTSPAGHCAGRSSRSAGRVATPAFRVWLCPERWCASICAAATSASLSVRQWDWSASQDRRTPVLSESQWHRSTAGHHARRLIVSVAWGSAVAMPPSSWWRRYRATTSGHSRRVRPAVWKPWRVQRAQVDGCGGSLIAEPYLLNLRQ